MILTRLYRIRQSVWWILLGMVVVGIAPWALTRTQIVDAQTAIYVVEPLLAVGLAVAARLVLGLRRDRVRHATDKQLAIGSVLAIWFVVYFLSGLILTYVHNAISASWLTIITNIVSFGATAIAVEYARHSVMLAGGRRNVMWFGLIVSVILAIQQMGLAQLVKVDDGGELVKFVVASGMPAIIASLLLTYISFTAGLGAQLVYRLVVLAIVIIPPIIPKYDWYLNGVTSMLVAIAVYITVDRMRQDADDSPRRHRHPRRAYDVMLVIVMTVLVMFMTGFFTYRPLAIVSNSMVPVFSRGSVVITQKISNPMDVGVGDILQYESDGRTITHRVIGIDTTTDGSGERVFTTKGDNSPSPDRPVTPKQVVGIVRAQVPYLGYPSVWLSEILKATQQ
ncbi:MAG: signal peptidase I [Candidatus Saccharimonadales bacterium]